jgi:hypothetical protein
MKNFCEDSNFVDLGFHETNERFDSIACWLHDVPLFLCRQLAEWFVLDPVGMLRCQGCRLTVC